MNVTLHLEPEVEKNLLARAQSLGIAVDVYLSELVVREAHRPDSVGNRFTNLSDLLVNSPFAGADLDLDRSPDILRSVDLP